MKQKPFFRFLFFCIGCLCVMYNQTQIKHILAYAEIIFYFLLRIYSLKGKSQSVCKMSAPLSISHPNRNPFRAKRRHRLHAPQK